MFVGVLATMSFFIRIPKFQRASALQTHQVYSMLKRRGNDRFHVVSTFNSRGVFVGKILIKAGILNRKQFMYSFMLAEMSLSLLNLSESRYIDYLRSANLSKSFAQLIVLIFISFLNIFFIIFCPVGKCGITPRCLYRDSLTLRM